MIVDSAVYRGGERLTPDAGAEDMASLRAAGAEEGAFVWVGLHQPDVDEFAEVAEVFGLHHLAVEDAVCAHQRPKLERYGENHFLILKTLWYIDAEDEVETGEISVFVGEDFVVTVRHGDGASLQPARQLLESRPHLLEHGPWAVVYAVCDTIVDSYGEVIDALQQDVDEIEQSVFSPRRTDDAARIYTLKREVAEVRRAILPLREPMRQFAGASVKGLDDEASPFFRDVSDHLARAAEAVDTLDLLLSSAFEAYMARISIQQNDDMRKISAGAALVVVPTLIAGVYGMNFTSIPELNWTYGYAYALLLMGITSAVLWWLFKRSGWL